MLHCQCRKSHHLHLHQSRPWTATTTATTSIATTVTTTTTATTMATATATATATAAPESPEFFPQLVFSGFVKQQNQIKFPASRVLLATMTFDLWPLTSEHLKTLLVPVTFLRWKFKLPRSTQIRTLDFHLRGLPPTPKSSKAWRLLYRRKLRRNNDAFYAKTLRHLQRLRASSSAAVLTLSEHCLQWLCCFCWNLSFHFSFILSNLFHHFCLKPVEPFPTNCDEINEN